jgi:hypothetical protein
VPETGIIRVGRPDGGGVYNIGLKFDDSNRLRIVRLHYAGRLDDD